MAPNNQSKQSRVNKVTIEEVHSNIAQEVIEITSDKLRIILKDHLDQVECKKRWATPASLLVAILLVFCTANFRDAFGVSADTWQAVFIIGGGMCFLWLVNDLRMLAGSMTLEELLDKIKNKS